MKDEDLATAAMCISDMLSTTLMPKSSGNWDNALTYIWIWDRRALNWLRDLQRRGIRPPINAWTAHVISEGYPFNCGDLNGSVWSPDNTETFDD